MSLTKSYNPGEAEPRLEAFWQEQGIYRFDEKAGQEVYSIDTPPPTVSGNLHLGHVYSYSHPDFIARFRRMCGRNVFYPMGYDDNGLPTERLVEQRLAITASQVGRKVFIERCLEISEQAEKEYQALWQRLGLSIDWRYTYRTIDELSRKTAQLSFIDLYHKGMAYRQEAPAIWCPECRTALAQADLNDGEQSTEYVTLSFAWEQEGQASGYLPVATTRPELLPSCVAIFVHPNDERYQGIDGRRVKVPLFDSIVPVLTDSSVEQLKGTGAVMCCTFGDSADVNWWYSYKLPLVESVGSDGRMTGAAGKYAGLTIDEARREIKRALEQAGLLLARQATMHTVRIHECCDTPVEYLIARQWFVRLLEFKELLLEAGERINWHPGHMLARYRSWVENLNWDWCISRQRYFGVPFPVWYCTECGDILLAEESDLPVDPLSAAPRQPCRCGSQDFLPEQDVMDTWGTSSLSPQIVGGWLSDPTLYERVFPFSLRPQAHEIIRTWAFYTIAKSHHHFGQLPWTDVLISGWGIAGEGMKKISKSRGGGPLAPLEMIERYSADALRYWAASTGPGKDAVISEEKIKIGAKLITKLWNTALFSERFLDAYLPPSDPPALSPADRWVLSSAQKLVLRCSELMENYDYAAAKAEVEVFFWSSFTDNYIEMSKQRLYDASEAGLNCEGARYTLYTLLLCLLKLLAPFMPYVTEEIFQGLFRGAGGQPVSIHASPWPVPDPRLEDDAAEQLGERLVEIATAVRRYKSEHSLPLNMELSKLQLAVQDESQKATLTGGLLEAAPDLISITRAKVIELSDTIDLALDVISLPGQIKGAVLR